MDCLSCRAAVPAGKFCIECGAAWLALAARPAAAEDRYQQALAIACAQSTKAFKLPAATSLARLWRSQGKRARAHPLLASLYAWFTEGFDTSDLIDAKALLDELK